jgi:2-polyprenyl-6-hydroxyphenyl methylase/3-demethylubiquinone-9 3-methyltransferase
MVKDVEGFSFGANWRAFLGVVDDHRVEEATNSIRFLLRADRLDGKTFIDVGCGSGLFSLSALILGCERVYSFDHDIDSVTCTLDLKRRFAPDAVNWQIALGDVLDVHYLRNLGSFDVVYSWGVVHHTGDMWRALENVGALVAPRGLLCLSIYNDQGFRSRLWTEVKRIYNRLPRPLRVPYAVAVMLPRELQYAAATTARFGPIAYLRGWKDYGRQRGMSRWHDLIDWVGGFPFEVAKPEEIFRFFHRRGFILENLFTAGGGLGCNQFVFRRSANT